MKSLARSKHEYILSFILLGVVVITGLLLTQIYGTNALSNPIAIVIFFTVIISACCILMFNRQIRGSLSEKERDRKQLTVICPRCMIPVKKELGICPQCGNKI